MAERIPVKLQDDGGGNGSLREFAADDTIPQSMVSGLPADLAAKEPAIAGGAADQYLTGSKTWANFALAVRSAVLTGLSTATLRAVAATDGVLVAVGLLQAQIAALTASLSDLANRRLGTSAFRDETILWGSAAGTAAAIAAGARPTVAISVPGAEFGDFVDLSLSVSAAGIEPIGYVSAAGTVTAVQPNPTGASITLGAHIIYARVTKRVPE